MIPSITAEGVGHAFSLLTDVAHRMGDQSPVFDSIADDVFDFERRWWSAEYGGEHDKDTRRGRNPAYMEETGGLHAAATRRGAPRQLVEARPQSLLVEVTHGLAVVHESRGREVLGVPGAAIVGTYLRKSATFILTGRS